MQPWRLGSSLDVYFHFAEAGDHYLGRILSGLDPNDVEFSTLSAHFNTSNPLENKDIKKAMHIMFGPILQHWRGKMEDPTGILLLFLCSIIYHLSWIKEIIIKNPGHIFSSIPIP